MAEMDDEADEEMQWSSAMEDAGSTTLEVSGAFTVVVVGESGDDSAQGCEEEELLGVVF